MSLFETLHAAKAARDFGAMVDAIPYARFLGLAVEEVDHGLLVKLPFSQKIVGNPTLPAIHGGVVGAFLENVAIFQLLWTLDKIRIPKTITVTIDYLRSAGPVTTYAMATVNKLGARVANVKAYAWQDDRARPVAGINANFLITPAE
jgi:acyl-coenzyme A thioesterase PaaI-like protein